MSFIIYSWNIKQRAKVSKDAKIAVLYCIGNIVPDRKLTFNSKEYMINLDINKPTNEIVRAAKALASLRNLKCSKV